MTDHYSDQGGLPRRPQVSSGSKVMPSNSRPCHQREWAPSDQRPPGPRGQWPWGFLCFLHTTASSRDSTFPPKPGQSRQTPSRSPALMEGARTSKGAPHKGASGGGGLGGREEAIAPGPAGSEGRWDGSCTRACTLTCTIAHLLANCQASQLFCCSPPPPCPPLPSAPRARSQL